MRFNEIQMSQNRVYYVNGVLRSKQHLSLHLFSKKFRTFYLVYRISISLEKFCKWFRLLFVRCGGDFVFIDVIKIICRTLSLSLFPKYSTSLSKNLKNITNDSCHSRFNILYCIPINCYTQLHMYYYYVFFNFFYISEYFIAHIFGIII